MNTTTANLSRYWNAEYRTFMNNVLAIVTEAKATTLLVSAKRAALKEQVESFNQSYIAPSANPVTSELESLDIRRDRAISGLKLLTENYSINHYDENIRMAASNLISNINSYGDQIAKQRYQMETGTLDKIIQDWEEDLADDVAICELTAWLDELKTANLQFNTKYVIRAQQIADDTGIAAGILRPAIDEAYHQLTASINARAQIADDEGNTALITEYNSVIAGLNVLTEQYNLAAEGRTSNPTDTEIDPNPTQPTPME